MNGWLAAYERLQRLKYTPRTQQLRRKKSKLLIHNSDFSTAGDSTNSSDCLYAEIGGQRGGG
jgi:hypothetical protein